MPIPEISAKAAKINLPEVDSSTISWPSYGQAAVGAKGYGVLATNGEQKSAPIASIAKTILALCVLEKKPLKVGQTGPTITITAQDAQFFHDYVAQNGSVLPVNEGEELTEYQALQGLLLPSGDNIADTLAIWAFGSIDNYLAYANKYVANLGLTKTHLGDPSGLSPQSVSSARDLVELGEVIMDNQVLAEIVGQSEVQLPVMGKARNYNSLLGDNGVVGIKTGNTEEAGGCLLFASKQTIDGKETMVIGAILGANNLAGVLKDTRSFLKNNVALFKYNETIKAGQTVGTYETPWGTTIEAVAKENITNLSVGSAEISAETELNQLTKATKADAVVGKVKVKAGNKTLTTDVVLKNNLEKPSIVWRMTHPF